LIFRDRAIHTSALAAAILCAASLTPQTAAAQTAAPFYAGKTLSVVVGSTAGGYYDTAGRVISRYLGNHIPGNPATVVKNQPTAGGLALANRLGEGMERDGLSIVVMSRALPQLALLGDVKATFDPLKLTWLGSLSSYKNDAYLMVVNETFPSKSIGDLNAADRKAILGGTRAGSTNITFALIARDLAGVKVDVVRGFPGANEIWLAMERGEMDGQIVDISAIMVGRPNLWAEKKLRPLMAFGRTERLPEYPDVPIGRELMKNADDLALLEFAELPFFMALPVVAPADLPPERAAILRKAFMDMALDTTFRDEMMRVGILTSPIDGVAVAELIRKASLTPMPVRERFRKLLAD